MSKKIKTIIGSAFLILLFGCQTTGELTGQLWNPVISKDEFSDKVTKMVTVGELRSSSLLVTRSLQYYPFVGVQDGEIYVGIRSGGPYRVPTGTVQIRVDENPSWTINPEETPVYLAPKTAAFSNGMASSPEMSEMMRKTQNQAINNAAKIMSPYTATTGEKAKTIIREMIKGKIVKYRTVGFNQAASTTGKVEIDASFISSLKSIGIDPEKI